MQKATPLKEDFSSIAPAESQLTKHSASISFELYRLFPSAKTITPQAIYNILSEFYAQHHPYCTLLSPHIINATLFELNKAHQYHFFRQPEITYVIPVHNCNSSTFRLTVNSLSGQIGVTCKSIFIIDGENKNDLLALKDALEECPRQIQHSIIVKKDNSGVSRARNTGMKRITSEFFSWIDANDAIHPLRSIHGIMMLINNIEYKRVNTSYSRINLASKKIAIRNMRFSFCGHTSFIAYTETIKKYGFLADIPYHEDTEYQQRLEYFKLPMLESPYVDHFLDIDISNQGSKHLSKDTWENVDAIEGHPFLGATYSGNLTEERQVFNQKFYEQYEKVLSEALNGIFPCLE